MGEKVAVTRALPVLCSALGPEKVGLTDSDRVSD